MMRPALAVAALLAALPALRAQEEKKPSTSGEKPAGQHPAAPDPKTKEHEALRALAGTWEITFKMTPAEGEPIEAKGREHAELVCGGLWLKATMAGEMAGKQHEGIWLLGYDPAAKVYRGICADNQESTPTHSEGRYDPKAKTWMFSGTNSMGRFETTAVVKDDDHMVETGTCVENGKESKIEITRTRTKGAQPKDASAGGGDQAADNGELAKLVGRWEAVMKASPQPGAPATDMPATETVVPVCGGRYVWTDYRMKWEGQPFEGHALMGYDPAKKQYVSYWIDSMTPTASQAAGTMDTAKKALVLEGTSKDMQGKPQKTEQTFTWKDADTRVMKMECRGEQSENFEITYRRKG